MIGAKQPGECIIAVLQIIHNPVYGLQISLFIVHDADRIRRNIAGVLFHEVEEKLKTRAGKYAVDQFNAEVDLKHIVPMQFQKTFQIRRCRIGGIKLGKGRRDEEYFIRHKGKEAWGAEFRVSGSLH